MSMMQDLIWQGDWAIVYRAACSRGAYRSGPLSDEDMARAAWLAG